MSHKLLSQIYVSWSRDLECSPTASSLFGCLFINREKAEEEERVRKEAEAEAAAQIAELDRQLKVRQCLVLCYTPVLVLLQCDYSNRATENNGLVTSRDGLFDVKI